MSLKNIAVLFISLFSLITTGMTYAGKRPQLRLSYYIVIGQSNAYNLAFQGKLAKKLHKPYNVVSIINCAYPGLGIDSFMPNRGPSSMYEKCFALAAGKRISGIVFWQGETDATNINLVKSWPEKANYVLSSMRRELGDENLKTVMVMLNKDQKSRYYPYWQSIRIFQSRLNLNNVSKIDSSPYPYRSEGSGRENEHLHLTPTGYDMMGSSIAVKLLSMK